MSVPSLQDALDLLQEKDMDEAINLLERKVNELPAHLTAHMLLARAYEAKHQWTQALQSWENAHFLLPNSPVVQEGKQRVLRRLGGAAETAAPELDPAPALPLPFPPGPTDDSTPAEDGATEEPDDGPDASELEELRRQTEKKVQRGGARPGLSAEVSSPTPEEHIEQLDDGDADPDLDHLIRELKSARIEPRPDMDEIPEPDLEDDVDDLVSETLARIHAAQDQYREAARIYKKLASQEPGQAREYRQKAAEMRKKADAAGDEGENT